MIFSWMLFLLFLPSATGDVCGVWFKDTQLKSGGECLLQCVAVKTDTNTVGCPDLCTGFCKNSLKERLIFNLSAFYPGLTKMERALSALYSAKTLSAYRLSWKAEGLCRKLFRRSQAHDASDACRHFAWAALLYQKFGLDFSTKVVYAHERDPKQSPAEKAMDEANNRLGFLVAKQMLKQGKLTEGELIKSFQKSLQAGRVVVLKQAHAQKQKKRDKKRR